MTNEVSALDVISRLSFGLLGDDDDEDAEASVDEDRNHHSFMTAPPGETTLQRRIEPTGSRTTSPMLQILLNGGSTGAAAAVSDETVSVAHLCDDVATQILIHLSLAEIAAVSETCKSLYQVCRSNRLWKYLFEYRWNVPTNGASSGHLPEQDYVSAYQRAHWYPHDLWVTHWNCVYPAEGLAPGRCCIRSMERKTRQAFHGGTVQCPTCRSHCDQQTTVGGRKTTNQPQTAAQAAAQRTQLLRRRLKAHGMELPDLCAHSSQDQAAHAFAAAATFHRQVDTTQYRPGMTHFLTDLLFFNLSDPFSSQGEWELEQLLHEAMEPPSDGGLHTASHHSWHIVELRNPHLYRPILYQFGVQRPDCFAVYPSEGLIEAGSFVHVTIGVTPLGSALAFSMEGLDILRDGLPGEWASLYTAEAHLPLSPFLIRYRFADMPPTPNMDARRPYVVSTEAADSKEAVLEHHFQQDFAPHHFRTIYLSGHVNAHYNFWEFWQRTCQPWIVERRNRQGPMVVAPILAEKYPRKWRQLDESLVSSLPFYRTRKYTEGPCEGCGIFWSSRDEELVYEFLAACAMAWWYQRQQRVLLRNIALCIEVVSAIAEKDEEAVSTLLYYMCSIIQILKASRLIDDDERRRFVVQEIAVDDLCKRIRVGGETWIPWRLSEVHRFARCTDSVFGAEEVYPDGKDEPAYLDAFRHLIHCPGSFCLGRQVDPNHVTSLIQPTSSRFVQKEGNLVSDIFMDDPISALQAGICMLQDP